MRSSGGAVGFGAATLAARSTAAPRSPRLRLMHCWQNMCQHFVITTSFCRWWHTLQLIMARSAEHSACTRRRRGQGEGAAGPGGGHRGCGYVRLHLQPATRACSAPHPSQPHARTCSSLSPDPGERFCWRRRCRRCCASCSCSSSRRAARALLSAPAPPRRRAPRRGAPTPSAQPPHRPAGSG